jgi:hypothetical protein
MDGTGSIPSKLFELISAENTTRIPSTYCFAVNGNGGASVFTADSRARDSRTLERPELLHQGALYTSKMSKVSDSWMSYGKDLESDRDKGHEAAAHQQGHSDSSCSRFRQMIEKLRKPVE